MPSLIELILRRGKWNASWWSDVLVQRLIRMLLNLVVFQRYEYMRDIEIPGFVNIEYRRDIRKDRRHARDIRMDMWEDYGMNDFDLRRLFGLEPYEEDVKNHGTTFRARDGASTRHKCVQFAQFKIIVFLKKFIILN